ncbi:aminopeptidase N [Shewanella sp. WXL01]|nr:aminopeptidase N [Shewanella sp. WXL01]NKF51314.1 aminopeptidase N [Shewanella sp. WXL01]
MTANILKRLSITASLCFAASLLTACQATQPTSLLERDQSANITQIQATARSEVISNVSYDLTFDITNEARFSASSKINFDLTHTDTPLTLDLTQAQIESFVINGKRIYPNYNGAYFKLNTGLLNSGSNSIEVTFNRAYNTKAEGLQRFVDPVDGKVYLYSHFAPAAAQQMFAVFDQPDLKAQFTLSVNAPKDWQVVSTMRKTQVIDNGSSNTWVFPQSPKLSPHNFSMHAGPYHIWQDSSGKYPIRLFARQSVAEHVPHQDWFAYTKQGLAFFDDYFAIEYPFKKYDQVLVPDLPSDTTNKGAIKNAAVTTFAEEHFLHQGQMTNTQKQSLAGAIMQGVTQQWFGNLVTMKWWNGLWLNESFASFMGTLALSENAEFSNVWRSFYATDKQSAYFKDSLVTTHPIEMPAPASFNAFDNIDAITNQKGASVLKQLRYLLGDETFRQGVNYYLSQFSYQNATLDDFINSLATVAKRDLSQWTQDWLYHAGTNTISAEYVCGNGKISEFNLLQYAASDELPTLREQKVQVGLFNQHRHGIDKEKLITVTYQGESTSVPELIGTSCPDLVYPNINDWGVVKVALDKRSFNTATAQLSNIKDPLLRSMLWQSMWDSVIDGNIGIDRYINVAMVNVPLETDYSILSQVIANLKQAKIYLDRMTPSHKAYSAKVTKALGQMSLRMVMQNKSDSDLQRRWFNAYIQFAQYSQALDHLDDLLRGHTQIAGIELDQTTRWQIIKQLNRFATPTSKRWLAQERRQDNSAAGQEAAIAAEVSRPDANAKRQWLARIKHDNSLSFAKKRIAMNALYPSEQKHFSQATAEQRLDELNEFEQKGIVFMRSFNQSLIPLTCSSDNIERLTQAINHSQELSAMTVRALREARQEEHRCIDMKAKLQP